MAIVEVRMIVEVDRGAQKPVHLVKDWIKEKLGEVGDYTLFYPESGEGYGEITVHKVVVE